MDKKPRRRLIPRFGIRWLLVFALIASVFFAWFARCCDRAKRETQLLDDIAAFNPGVTFNYEKNRMPGDPAVPPPGPEFLRDRFGDNLFAYVDSLTIHFNSSTNAIPQDDVIDKIGGFRQLEVLSIRFSDAQDLSPIASIRTIEELDLILNEFSDYSCLQQLPNLKKLSIGHPYVQIEDWTWLGEIESLESLDLSSSRINKLPSLLKLKNLEFLDLKNCSRLESTAPVADLKNLTRLSIGKGTPLQILDMVDQLPNLEFLDLQPYKQDKLSVAEIEGIRRRFPHAKVTYSHD